MPPPRPLPLSSRFEALDALRGLAVVWMTVYHFCFDLNHFGYLRQDFLGDAFWTSQRTAIVSLFLFCAGMGQAAAQLQSRGAPRFWQRWAQIAACALLVSAASWLIFPASFIYFGVLHAIAVMLLVVQPLSRWGQRHPLWLAVLATVLLLLPLAAPGLLVSSGLQDLFNSRALNWLGWISRKPFTEDYVPLLPWAGVMVWGLLVGQAVLRKPPDWLMAPLPGGGRPLIWLGRHSLGWYMLHQPVLMGLLASASWLIRP
ncbi:MAG: heparan-alpha-glucosaminide N-acetyltransferase [Burkholderiaceae bacterium]|nr:heparan-alpha-glucosaminide N-acetyltransferase [Burkholderiaceae bacterium]MDO9090403.1 heparan-alpha-glucosaminide N-acetyltransferase [Burkholderiaceae bacterium]